MCKLKPEQYLKYKFIANVSAKYNITYNDITIVFWAY